MDTSKALFLTMQRQLQSQIMILGLYVGLSNCCQTYGEDLLDEIARKFDEVFVLYQANAALSCKAPPQLTRQRSTFVKVNSQSTKQPELLSYELRLLLL